MDVDFVRKAVRAIGRLAVKIESAADRCIAALLELIQTKVNYVVQEAIIVIRVSVHQSTCYITQINELTLFSYLQDIFRKYPNQYESIISTLCENLDDLDEPEAKASMIWIIGQYADRIENADQLLDDFLYTFLEDPYEVQLALLTATVKLFVQRPTVGQELVPKVLKWATEEVDNPDLRDRGYIYWRLLSTDPAAAKAVVLSDKPAITTESDNLDPNFLDELLLHIGSLASIYHKSPTAFINRYKPRYLLPSPALQPRSNNDNYKQQQLQQQQPIIQQEQQYQQQQQLQQQQLIQQQDSLTAQFNDWSYNAATSNNRVVSTQSNNPYSTDLLQ